MEEISSKILPKTCNTEASVLYISFRYYYEGIDKPNVYRGNNITVPFKI